MPEFFAQGEAGARGLARDTRRCDAQRPQTASGLAAKRGVRGKQSGVLSENYHNENSHAPPARDSNCRRSPRLSSFAGATGASRNYGRPTMVAERAFGDITNVTAGRAAMADKAKATKPSQHSFQPPAVQQSFQPPAAIATTRELPPAAPRDLPTVAPTAAAVDVSPEDKSATSVASDPQCVQEYTPDIINQFFSTETLALPRSTYMDMQTDITPKMRMILIDWLIEVHMKYRLAPETLHLTVNLIDRYLSVKQITRKKLQLIGVAAMFIASKFEEINPPELHDWVYITDNAYTKEDVLLLECNMLTTLSFKIVVPTAAHFFEHLATVNGCDAVQRANVQYVLELGLLDTRMLQYKPSLLVSAAILLSNELFARSPAWPDAMIQEGRHSQQALRQCAEELKQLWAADRAGAGAQLQAVHKKFSLAQRHSVATMSFSTSYTGAPLA